jgi:hypothetical protein
MSEEEFGAALERARKRMLDERRKFWVDVSQIQQPLDGRWQVYGKPIEVGASTYNAVLKRWREATTDANPS